MNTYKIKNQSISKYDVTKALFNTKELYEYMLNNNDYFIKDFDNENYVNFCIFDLKNEWWYNFKIKEIICDDDTGDCFMPDYLEKQILRKIRGF